MAKKSNIQRVYHQYIEDTDGDYIVPTFEPSNNPVDVSEIPEVVAARPYRLTTYYPLISQYPFTGHSALSTTATTDISKSGSSADYNFFTNNCADATLRALQYGAGETPNTDGITTPGDAREYALSHYNTHKLPLKHGYDQVVILPTLEQGERLKEAFSSYHKKEAENHKQISLKQNGGSFFDWLDTKADEWEPYTSGLGLASDAVGLGTALSGVGAPIGGAIALVGNVPNLALDLYQAGRGWYKTATEGAKGNIGNAVWNTTELALDILGSKLAAKGFKWASDKKMTQEIKRRITDEIRKRQGQRFMLRKKGMSDADIDKYIATKAANTVMNSKDIIDGFKRKKKQVAQKTRIAGHVISGVQNGVHLVPEAKSDNARVVYFR